VTRLEGKVALVTGAASGIGAAIARAFVAEGAIVFLADLETASGEALAGSLERARFLKLDVTKEAEWIAAFAEVGAAAGRLDVQVNNAGINIRKPIEEMSETELDAMLAVNVKGPFLGIKHALPLLRRSGGGSIINMSSICGLIGHRFTPEAYSLTKGALTLLTRSIASRYGKENIRCNAVHPSTVETPMVRNFLSDPKKREERVNEVPLGRLASEADVAAAFVYLASTEASFINGISLPVDGGLTIS
jgi:NAD(P)-dependent dehydrogenase (short-subunit alcohol dehydrogenase family)